MPSLEESKALFAKQLEAIVEAIVKASPMVEEVILEERQIREAGKLAPITFDLVCVVKSKLAMPEVVKKIVLASIADKPFPCPVKIEFEIKK